MSIPEGSSLRLNDHDQPLDGPRCNGSTKEDIDAQRSQLCAYAEKESRRSNRRPPLYYSADFLDIELVRSGGIESGRFILAILVHTRMFVSEGAALTFGTLDPQAIARPAAKKRCRTNHSATLVTVAILAINLEPLLSPVQEGETNELFIKRKPSQA